MFPKENCNHKIRNLYMAQYIIKAQNKKRVSMGVCVCALMPTRISHSAFEPRFTVNRGERITHFIFLHLF